MEKSCKVWNSQIIKAKDEDKNEIIGRNGDIEHLRNYLGDSQTMKPNTLYWITDRTPHESLVLVEGTYRQYFRLVTHQVSLWFEDHSTKNPFGIHPDTSITQIVKGSKFDDPQLLKII